MDLALNNLEWLLCHKTQTTNQPFLHHVLVLPCEISLGCHLKEPYVCFFFYLFSVYFCSVDRCVVSGRCNQPLFVCLFFYEIF